MGTITGNLLKSEDLHPFEEGVWWVDDVGNFHQAGEFDDSFDAILMRHLGQVRLAASPTGIKIKWDSEFVIEDTLAGVIARLLACRIDIPVFLDFCFHGWISDYNLTPSQAIDRIRQVQMFRSVDILYPTRIQELPVSETASASPLIKNGFEHWRQSGGRFDRLSNGMLAGMLPKAMIYRPDGKKQDIVFSWIGSRSYTTQIYGNELGRAALGQPLDRAQGTENANYVNKISNVYGEIWETGEPRYQFVRTLISRDGVEPEWLHYARLITRCILHDGTPSLVCLSEPIRNQPVPLPGMP